MPLARSSAGSRGHLHGRARGALLSLLCLGLAQPAFAHETGLSYLRVRVDDASLDIEIDLGLGDAAAALGLASERDPNADPETSRALLWERIASRADELEMRVRPALGFWQDGAACVLSGDRARLSRAEETGFARLRFWARCPRAPSVLGLAWTLPFENDPQHHAMVSVSGGGAPQGAILSARRERVDLDLGSGAPTASFASFLAEGVRHIASGPDHLLFLIALLLPAPLAWNGRSWSVRPSAARVVVEVVQIVTAFTVAHSVTLCLAVLGAVTLPGVAVEAAIAASVMVAALNGLRPFLPARAWQIAFAFGLLHGLGFARYLTELGLPRVARATALFAFNLGVEIGQLGVVAVCLPILLAVRRWPFYRRWLLASASAAIAGIAAVWLVQRASGWPLVELGRAPAPNGYAILGCRRSLTIIPIPSSRPASTRIPPIPSVGSLAGEASIEPVAPAKFSGVFTVPPGFS